MNFNEECRTSNGRVSPRQKGYGINSACPKTNNNSRNNDCGCVHLHSDGCVRNSECNKRHAEGERMTRDNNCGCIRDIRTTRISKCECKNDNGAEKEQTDNCHPTVCTTTPVTESCVDNYPIAMAYVPMQQWRDLYDPISGLSHGTVFRELDLPWYPTNCRKDCTRDR